MTVISRKCTGGVLEKFALKSPITFLQLDHILNALDLGICLPLQLPPRYYLIWIPGVRWRFISSPRCILIATGSPLTTFYSADSLWVHHLCDVFKKAPSDASKLDWQSIHVITSWRDDTLHSSDLTSSNESRDVLPCRCKFFRFKFLCRSRVPWSEANFCISLQTSTIYTSLFFAIGLGSTLVSRMILNLRGWTRSQHNTSGHFIQGDRAARSSRLIAHGMIELENRGTDRDHRMLRSTKSDTSAADELVVGRYDIPVVFDISPSQGLRLGRSDNASLRGSVTLDNRIAWGWFIFLIFSSWGPLTVQHRYFWAGSVILYQIPLACSIMPYSRSRFRINCESCFVSTSHHVLKSGRKNEQ